MSEQKTWSLQNDKRTADERNVFKPTGKTPKNNIKIYLLSLAGVFLLVSFLLTYFSDKKMEACLSDTYCFNSKDSVLVYTFYVFFNIIIVVLAIYGAYIFGKKLADFIKK